MLKEFVKVGSVADLAAGKMLAVPIGQEEVMVARIGDEYFAVDMNVSNGKLTFNTINVASDGIGFDSS